MFVPGGCKDARLAKSQYHTQREGPKILQYLEVVMNKISNTLTPPPPVHNDTFNQTQTTHTLLYPKEDLNTLIQTYQLRYLTPM